MITLRGQAYFGGARIGLRIRSAGEDTSVEYYEQRRARPLYWSMVSGCLQQKPSGAADGATEPGS
ncbi:hypothetical protein PTKU64_88190 [Paraburkholderia terrae]|uniref:Uncharacterized protein n=1 Tax=Paraburkholderia terrae TaxID=311230 RepID=A0ABM7UBD4_9BURK|nr:hypothetical protein PTKU64_88190 [Paraburkholderia terrae]